MSSRRVALVGVLIAFALSVGFGLSTLRASSARVERLLGENHVWAATQAHSELVRLENALVHFGADRDAASLEAMRVRLDVVWSRLPVLEEGDTGAFLIENDLFQPVVELRTTLVALDDLIDGIAALPDPVFDATLDEALMLVQTHITAMRQWGLDVLHADRTRLLSYVRQRTDAVWWVVVSFAILAASGLMVVAFLLLEIRTSKQKTADAEASRQAAAAAEQRLIDAIEAIPEGFALYDAEDRLVLCNRRYRELYRVSAPAIVPGNTFEQIIRYGVERGQYAEAAGRVEEWVAERVHQHRHPSDSIEQLLGSQRWLRIEERITSEGGVVGVRMDITDIKRAQTLLLRAERAANLGHFSVDLATGNTVWSEQTGRLLGLPPRPTTMTEATLLDRLVERSREALSNQLALAKLGRHAFDGIVQTVPIDDVQKWLAVKLFPETDTDGRVREVFGTIQDVTQKYQTEIDLERAIGEATAANEAKSRFLSIMSHEIRTPMNGVVGGLNLINLDQLGQRDAQMIGLARASANRLRAVVNDILDFTRIEAGKLELEIVTFDPRAFLEEAVDFWRAAAEEKGLKLHAGVATLVAERLVGDAGRLRQVVDNLISNAIKYTDRGEVQVAMTGTPPDPLPLPDAAIPEQRLTIRVTDTGRGIAPADRDRVFVDYSQLHSADRLTIGGSGLGLAICKRLVTIMGGTIDFDSRPGVGSSFRVELMLPVAEIEPAEAATRRLPVRTDASIAPGTRVLVAEDNRTNQIVTEHALEALGCAVDVVENGQEAVAALRDETYDVVLMDVSMPVMDGIAATRQIRADGDETPILAFTAHAMIEDRQRFLEAGMTGIVAKPVITDELARAIGDVLAKAGTALPEGEPVPVAQAPCGPQPQPTAAALTASEPDRLLFDLSVVESLREALSPDTFGDLCTQFRVDVDRCLSEADSAMAAGDRAGLDRASHTLCSVAATLGAEALEAIAREINTACRETEAGASPEAVSQLRQVAAETLRCFSACIVVSEPCHAPVAGRTPCQQYG